MALDATLPQLWSSRSISLTVTDSTRAKVLVDKQIAAGNLLGGFRIIDGQVASTDGTARSLIVWQGEELTLAADMGTASIATTSTITRSAGDFLANGWKPTDSAMLLHGPIGPYAGTAANYGTLLQVTAVAAGTLTFNGTPLTAETMQAGSRIVRVAQRTRLAIAINAGNADATPPVPLMTGTQNPSSAALPDTGWQYGDNSLVMVSVAAAISALPARIDVIASIGRY
jgi:hypothetical protein